MPTPKTTDAHAKPSARTADATPPSHPLPAALEKRAAAAVARKRARLLEEAHDLITLIRRKRDTASEAFYDMGLALRRLGEREMLAAIGVKTFADLCELKLDMSAATGAQLVEIVTRMTREEAVAMGQSKAAALVALAKATPGPDTPGGLFRKRRVRLPNGVELDTRTTSVRAIKHAAKQLRDAQHHHVKPRRGRTTTAAERTYAERLEQTLREHGLDRATVEAIATKPGHASDLRIAHVPMNSAAVLAKALRDLGDLR